MQTVIKPRSSAKDYALIARQTDAMDAVLCDIFSSRGSEYHGESSYNLAKLEHPKSMKGLSELVAILADAIEHKQKILIVGDFDADGATSTAVGIKCLQAFGHQLVDFLVPNRFLFGYGLTPEIVDVASESNPDIILTVDNGISSIEGVKAAKDKGIKVLVTDHHLPGKETPEADAIVNPNQRGCDFPSKNLAGVGVLFYVMSALRTELRSRHWFERASIAEPNMSSFLDLVALGTVADVVPLDYNNRILVHAGLQRMRAGLACAGIRGLLNIAGKAYNRLSASDLGFILGPRLNAAGRLDDMRLGIQCLLCENEATAQSFAQELDDLNRDRKLIESSMQSEAEKLLTALGKEDLSEHAGVCLYKADWHQGVIGILASRIKDKLHRPTIVFANDDQGELKGSGRSIAGVHLRDVLDEVASAHPGLLTKFGGHAMAAGLSLAPNRLEEFSRAFDAVVARHLDEENSQPVLFSDGQLPEELISLTVAQKIQQAGPWGQHFSEPLFDGVFQVVQQRLVGEKHLKLVLTRETYSSQVFDAICFNVDLNKWPNQQAQNIHIAYHLDINEFRGNVQVQLLVRHIEALLS